MSQTKAVLLKIKEGQWEVWRDWCRELSGALRFEAVLTLQEEKVLQEMALGFQINGERYVIGFVEGEALPAKMDREINQRHQAMKLQCLEHVEKVEILYIIKNNS